MCNDYKLRKFPTVLLFMNDKNSPINLREEGIMYDFTDMSDFGFDLVVKVLSFLHNVFNDFYSI